MGLSATQRFLREAHRAAGPSDYFRWGAVGTTLGYSDDRSIHALKSLEERKLLILLVGGNARLLQAGRRLAMELETRATGG